MARPFRKPESYESELITRDMLVDFLRQRGFAKIKEMRQRRGQSIVQSIIAAAPDGQRMKMRVRLCWVRERKQQDASRTWTYSAAQIMGKIKGEDWEGSLSEKVRREQDQGVTHFLFVQREEDRIISAALVPLPDLVPIWCEQRNQFDRLIKDGRLGRTKRNPAQNGSSPTLHLQKDGAPQAESALWKHPGVMDLAKIQPATGTMLLTNASDQNVSSFSPETGDLRAIVQRQIHERRGQSAFRDSLLDRYEGCCLVTGCQAQAVLEAAHIKPYRGDNDHHPENGLLLRADIHTLFDLDLLGIDPDHLRIELHPDLAKHPEYANLQGQPLHCPPNRRPSSDALRIRYEQFQNRSRSPA